MKNQNSQAALHAAGWPDFYMKLRKRERGGGRVRVEKLATLLGPHQMLAAGLSQERTGCLKKIMSIMNEPKANKEMQFAQRKSTGTKTGEIIPKEL